MTLGIKDDSLVIPGRGTLFVGDKDAPLSVTAAIKAFANINSPSVTVGSGETASTFLNLGHTSSDNLFALNSDGGSATSKRTWLKNNVTTVYDDIAWTLTGNSVQWDKDTLTLIYNGWATTDGDGVVVGSSKKSMEKSLVLVSNSGDGALGFYIPNAALTFGDAPSLDLTNFAEIPFSAAIQSAASTALPASSTGEAGLFAIYGPAAFLD